MHNLVVSPEDNGKRVDNVATKNIVALRPELEISRTIMQRLIEEGHITLNKNPVKVSYKVKEGDTIEIDSNELEKEGLLEKESKTPRAEKVTLDIIYEDSDILVVNKPAGMVVHPACGNYSGTMVNALLNYEGFLTDFNKPRETNDQTHVLRPGIVHRLDKETSGVMLVAKTGVSLRRLSNQLKAREVSKVYIAVCRGIIGIDECIINAPIGHDERDRRRMAIDIESGKEAITYIKVIKRDIKENFTVVEARPKTGRTHQIRVHLMHIGHPVLGDKLYNNIPVNELSNHALHALSIKFIHPRTNKEMEFSASLPESLKKYITL